MNSFEITRPDDWHVHLRDGIALRTTVPAMARYFGRCIAMPNLVPPVSNAGELRAYRDRIMSAQRSCERQVEPLMVLYLTDNTGPEEIICARAAGAVACKLYPAGATTNSDSGVTDIQRVYPALEAMQRVGMHFLVHGEVTDADVDVFDREKVFVDRIFSRLTTDFPELHMVLEHITTKEAVEFVMAAGPQVAATITPQHLLYDRNDMLVGGIRPHLYCLPILKRGIHRRALIEAATSGNVKFFLGTDSAPHSRETKESDCGCAGCYTAFAAIEFYAEVFEDAGALPRLEAFASHYGADFYGLPRNTDSIRLCKTEWQVPSEFKIAEDALIPLRAGERLRWQVVG